jgi:hypothetical protein
MIAVISVLAFSMAFGAIWFTSETIKRLDNNNEALIRPYLKKINATFDEHRDATRALLTRLEKLERQVQILKHVAEVPKAVEREVAAIQSGVNDLQRFTPTVRLNG